MRLKESVWVIFCLVMCMASWCATSSGVTLSPEKMAEEGLLVAKFNDNGGIFYDGHATIVNIDNLETISAEINNKRLMVQLKPGKYNLNRIGQRNQFGASWYDFSVKFEIRPGFATNLGVLLLYSVDPGNKEKQIFLVDNSDDVRHFLKYNYSQIYERMNAEILKLEPDRYMTPQQIYRQRHLMFKDIPTYALKEKYAYSILGSLFEIQRDRFGKVVKRDLIPTDTYEDIDIVSEGKDRFACLVPGKTSKHDLIILNDGKLSRLPIPEVDEDCHLHLYGRSSVVIFDRYLRVATSHDNGASWLLHPEVKLENPVLSSWRIGFHEGKSGIYIFSRDTDSTLLFQDTEGAKKFKQIPSPVEKMKIVWVKEIDEGLFLMPLSGFSKDIYFLDKAGSSWVKKELPTSRLGDIYGFGRHLIDYRESFQEKEGKIFILMSEQCWESDDMGNSWAKVGLGNCKAK